MKTAYFAFAIVLVSAHSLRAQVHIGLTAGINVMSVSSDLDAAEYGHYAGMAIGGIVDVPVTHRFSIRFEPKYSRNRSVPRFDIEPAAAHHVNHVDYVTLPVLLNYSLPATSGAIPYLELGPTIGVKLGADFQALLPGGLTGSTNSADISDDIRTVDMGLAIGSGLKFRAGSGWLHVTGRYSFSLLNIYDYPYGSECADCTLPVELGNNGFQFLVGFSVPVAARRRP